MSIVERLTKPIIARDAVRETIPAQGAMTTEELIVALRALAADLGRHPGAATATDAADRLSSLTAPVEGMTLETTEDRALFDSVERALEEKFGAKWPHEPGAQLVSAVTMFLRGFLSPALAAERLMNQLTAEATAVERLTEVLAAERDRADQAEAALWRIAPNVYTVEMEGGQKPDPFEGPGETYHDAYVRERDRNERLAGALREAIGIASTYSAGRCSQETTARLAALSQEKQP